ncbi:hypothetical protein RB2654_08487 [Rhodobacterales bacterium HTCC2654]|uniref:Uncharacterized protein n=1 Tax=Maritimibacter alkaliphilus HTCC2654 TaxID=314271 RepID=A3VHN8_9RHOB|nr:hypothetical protein RB2654_08487 [Rhodobacterales bacterium HTCC2654] [Maritimibacter alkaliphilus HTCC2654]
MGHPQRDLALERVVGELAPDLIVQFQHPAGI